MSTIVAKTGIADLEFLFMNVIQIDCFQSTVIQAHLFFTLDYCSLSLFFSHNAVLKKTVPKGTAEERKKAKKQTQSIDSGGIDNT